MKNIFTSKKIFKIGFFMMLLCTAFSIVTSCKDDDDEVEKPASYNVQFKATATNGAALTAVIYQIGTLQTSDYTVTGASWQSQEFSVPTSEAQVSVSARAQADPNNPSPDAGLKIEILVNGEVKATKEAQGEDVTLSTVYSFLD